MKLIKDIILDLFCQLWIYISSIFSGKRIIVLLLIASLTSCEILDKSTSQCYPQKTVKVKGPKRISY
jgi:hypothetical protein